MLKHWTGFLPEAGEIADLGDRIRTIEQTRSTLEEMVAALNAEIAEIEEAAEAVAEAHWTPEDITAAKELEQQQAHAGEDAEPRGGYGVGSLWDE